MRAKITLLIEEGELLTTLYSPPVFTRLTFMPHFMPNINAVTSKLYLPRTHSARPASKRPLPAQLKGS